MTGFEWERTLFSPIQERPVDRTAVTGMPFSNDKRRERSPGPLTSDGSDAVYGGRTTSGRGLEVDSHAIYKAAGGRHSQLPEQQTETTEVLSHKPLYPAVPRAKQS